MKRLITWIAPALLMALSAPAALEAGERSAALDAKRLAALEESAQTADDWRELARLYEERARHFEEKAQRHEKLKQRYAAAPKSLLAKRGHGWNTPGTQQRLAEKAREEARLARQSAAVHLARADSESVAVD